MLPPVVVDLGPDVASSALAIVLDACNDAIERGQCVPAGSGGEEAPRALAVARPGNAAVLVVRIEIRIGADDSEPSIVRELQFSRRDPLRERWRSVGLAIATLVGEGEQRAIEEAAAAPPEPEPEPEPPPPAVEAAPQTEPEPEPPEPAEAREAPEPEEAEEEVPEEPEAPPEPVEYAPLFVGLGIVTGPGFGGGPWRVGGSLRGTWAARSGFSVTTSMGATWRATSETFTASWLFFDAGVGYRFALSEATSLGATLFGGAQRARFEVLVEGVSAADTRWNPRIGASLDGWWRTASGFGLWANVEATTVGRESLLFVSPGADPIRSQPFDAAAMLGAGWWFR
jgi:hypothetical protein